MGTRNAKTLVPAAKLIKIGDQVINLDDAVELQGRTVKIIVASKTADFRTSHKEVANGLLIGTVVSLSGGDVEAKSPSGFQITLTATEVLGRSLSLKFSNQDTLEDLVDDILERPLGAGGGRAVELTVMIEPDMALVQNQTNDGGLIAQVIGTDYSLNAVSLEKEFNSREEVLAQLQANLDKNRGIRQESIRQRRSITQEAGVAETATPVAADASLPPVV